MTAISLVGTAHTLALFARGKDGVVVDTSSAPATVLELSSVQELLAKFNWTPAYPGAVALAVHQAAATALGSCVEILNPERPRRERPYAVPKNVQATARRALAQPPKGGADQLSVSTARQLSSGQPVTLAKVRQVARMLADLGPESAEHGQFWGGLAGRKWALGVLDRAGLTAASDTPASGSADAADAATPLIEIPEDATNEDIYALMRDGATEVDMEEEALKIAEDVHSFMPSPRDPEKCIYCGGPPDWATHDLPNRFPQDPNQPHWFEYKTATVCAVCGKSVDDEIHDLTIKPPSDDEAPDPGPVTASYLPSEVLDVSPAQLASVLSAEQSDDRVRYFARMIPGGDESADAVLQRNELGWSEWKGNTWLAITAPDYPVQLLDEASAYTLADQLSVFPEVSIHAIDLDERALFEAARAELEADMEEIDRHTYLAVPPDDNEVSYSVVHDAAAPGMATQLYASINEMHYVWDYVDNTWTGVDGTAIDTGLSSPVSFDDAMLIAHVQSRDGVSPMTPELGGTDLDQAAGALEETGFFNLFAGTLLNVPDDFDAVDLDVTDGPDSTDGDPESIEPEDLSEELFCFEIDPADQGQVKALHVQLPDSTWLTWNPAAVAWVPGAQPENSALVDGKTAAEFAAFQYDQEHGGAISTPDEGSLLTAIQGEEFANGFSKIFSLTESADDDAVPDQPIYFSDQSASIIAAGPISSGEEQRDEDGYTAEERSKNAQKQVRDKFGRFAIAQARVVLPDGKTRGTINKIDPERKTVEVKGDDGKVYDVPADQVQVIDEPAAGDQRKTANYDDLLAQPRATGRTPKAFLPYTLPPMDATALKAVVSGYQKFIEAERASEEQKRKAKEKLGRAAEEPSK